MQVRFEAPDYHADGHFSRASYRFEGSPEQGWRIERDGERVLDLGPGYRLLETLACGVCSTDLARQFLPFPLPQVTGHELVVRDASGRRHVVEINASCLARGAAAPCAYCRSGLERHCPERIVLGIHDLPGGFGPFVLAPERAVLPVPDALPTETALLVEPFAAALNGVARVAPRDGDRVAVLGPRRLGMLLVAALAGYRARHGLDFEIVALARRAGLLELARDLGADDGLLVSRPTEGHAEGEAFASGSFDVVFDTTGTASGLELAIRIAGREVHLKSTHGQPAAGLVHLTEAVVDELTIEPLPADPLAALSDGERIAWLCNAPPPARAETRLLVGREARALLEQLERDAPPDTIARAAAAVVDGPERVDAVIRPDPEREVSLVRPRGTIWIHPSADTAGSSLLAAVHARGLRLSTSRCGDFREALDLLEGDPRLRSLGARVMTHRFAATEIARAFEVAASPACIKAFVEHAPKLEESVA